MSLLRSTAVVGSLTLVSRITGFIREILLAVALGAGPVTDAFLVAFRLPNLFRRVFAEGAFNAAFVPLYSGKLEADGEEAAGRFASETASMLVFALAALIIAAQVAMPWIIAGFAPGYLDDPDWRAKAVVMGQIMFPYILFMSLMAMFGGVLNAHGRFAAFAIAPVLLNLVMIGVLALAPSDPWAAARNLSMGVAAAGVLQLGFVYLGMRRQRVRVRLGLPRLTPGVKRVIALGVPGAAAAGVTQINMIIGQMIASIREAAVSWLAFADRIYQLPLGMIGVAMGVALLPALSRSVKAGDHEGARQSLNAALELAALFTLPATAALLVAGEFFVKAAFEHGAFSPASTGPTGAALTAYAAGLPAFIAVKVLSPAFFAREDTKTPMQIAVVTVAANIAIGVGLFYAIGPQGNGFVGLAIGTSAAGWLNATLLAAGLVRRGEFAPTRRLTSRLVRIAAASVVMGAAVWAGARFARPYLDVNILNDLVVAGAVAAGGAVVYAAAALAVGAASPRDLRRALRRG